MEIKYSLETPKGIERLLKQVPYIQSRAYDSSDYTAVDILTDLETAVKKAKLTEEENKVVQELYFSNQTMTVTAKEMGLVVSQIHNRKQNALEKISKVYKGWGYDNDVI
jgi:DNA-directed RNA polymerase specialized sigma subunit